VTLALFGGDVGRRSLKDDIRAQQAQDRQVALVGRRAASLTVTQLEKTLRILHGIVKSAQV